MMTEPIGLGLHVCTSIDEKSQGINCDKAYYDPSELIFLHVSLKGRPDVKDRVLRLLVNGVVADSINIDEGNVDFMHVWVLDDKYLGMLRVEYVENGLAYWARQFSRGRCVLPTDVNRLSVERLIYNLMKIRGQI
jgi:hypothetical protein